MADNPNPVVHSRSAPVRGPPTAAELDDDVADPIDELELFDMLRNINDPEHPLTLEQLNVVTIDSVTVDDEKNMVKVLFRPTIEHCSMATLIGLSIRVKLLRSLPKRFKVEVGITPGAHATEDQVNKQLKDKERCAAALENPHLTSVVNEALAKS